jgi:hypothetical protein
MAIVIDLISELLPVIRLLATTESSRRTPSQRGGDLLGIQPGGTSLRLAPTAPLTVFAA